MKIYRVLHLPVEDGIDVMNYLLNLLDELWTQKDGFSGKRPFGDSGWEYDLYAALARGGAIEARFDRFGDLEEFNRAEADELIHWCILAMRDL